ncbi:PAS domain-containing sensor histidine kinase [Ramlibacter sp. USB13]|uniref:PAS domain-containing sensor histidine kinase n=1 Tax=Ramlibacter cellulosilyticus TaxID=2764187 RepID=A0A923MPJ8_9BURK|nr:PAS domain-containing sensor histidine kinase [Ramlibacter cellulosilyticus]MBC5783140.1 PAS domain-containing sensor histidine kinase [Ramlibacter cellulosilyticus]
MQPSASLSLPSDDSAAARLAGLLDSAMDGIISVDDTQRIVIYNRAAERMFGWKSDEVRGKSLDLLIPERYRRGHGQQVRRFGATGTTSRRMGDNTVLYAMRKDGSEFPIDASISQLQTPEGKLYTVILRDVTERVRAREELANFAAESAGVREQEKSRIARELHDELAQSLTALKMDTIWLRDHVPAGDAAAHDKMAQMLALLDSSVAAVRRIAADLRPLVLDDLGLVPAIEWVVQSFTQRSGVPCELDLDESLELKEPYATGVFRIVQESLNNVAKHARATRVRVVLRPAGEHLLLRVEDDGIGFRLGAPRPPQSLGLVGLRERAQLLRGEVRVESSPGAGTRVEARIPLVPEGTP